MEVKKTKKNSKTLILILSLMCSIYITLSDNLRSDLAFKNTHQPNGSTVMKAWLTVMIDFY